MRSETSVNDIVFIEMDAPLKTVEGLRRGDIVKFIDRAAGRIAHRTFPPYGTMGVVVYDAMGGWLHDEVMFKNWESGDDEYILVHCYPDQLEMVERTLIHDRSETHLEGIRRCEKILDELLECV